MKHTAKQLLKRLEVLRNLNPDSGRLALPELLRLAAQTDPASFHRVAEFAADLLKLYLNSPWKSAEKLLLNDYFLRMNQAARLLTAKGELSADAPAETPESSSVALVSRRLYGALDWCRLQSRAEIPTGLARAIEASRYHNRLVESVMETMLAVLHRLDETWAFEWELQYLESQRGALDADLVRDLLKCWRRVERLPAAVLPWVMRWSADANLARQWPAVVELADALLRQLALRQWARTASSRHAGTQDLQKVAGEESPDEEILHRWLAGSIAEIGESVHFFIALSEAMLAGDEDDDVKKWRQAALFREVGAIAALFTPVLILADLLFNVPGGANRFALALFGLGRTGEDQWRHRVEKRINRSILRFFLTGFKQGTAALDLIRTMCFGDPELFQRLSMELDLGTKQFDSLKQRDKVIDRLTLHYFSLRERALLGEEIARRYRSLMRVMHEDNLARLLTPEQFAETGELTMLREIMAIATAARRFLRQRRDLEASLEEMVAVEMEFVLNIRERRRSILRRLLLPERQF